MTSVTARRLWISGRSAQARRPFVSHRWFQWPRHNGGESGQGEPSPAALLQKQRISERAQSPRPDEILASATEKFGQAPKTMAVRWEPFPGSVQTDKERGEGTQSRWEPLVCERLIMDDVASRDLCMRAVAACRSGLASEEGPERLLPPLVPAAEEALGLHGLATVQSLIDRVTHIIVRHFQLGEGVEIAGALLNWISGTGTDGKAKGVAGGAFTPHVDKANREAYDVSAVLYLSSGGGVDFTGGDFAFMDPECDRVVIPVAGRLLAFTSGFENLHCVRPVEQGNRFVLAIWYTCPPSKTNRGV